jgi:hypothetical protein
LKGFIITASTEDRHRKAAGQFFAYLRRQREVIPQTPELMDALVSQFTCELWEEGRSKSLAGDVLSSIQHHQPSLKGQLRVSWRYFRAWQQAEVPARAPPLSLQTLATLKSKACKILGQLLKNTRFPKSCMKSARLSVRHIKNTRLCQKHTTLHDFDLN